MPGPWRDINDVGFSSAREQEEETSVVETEEAPEPIPEDVRFINADEWTSGDNGFSFNEISVLGGTLEYLTAQEELGNRKIEGDLFVETEDGEVEEIKSVAKGFAEDDGSFKMDVKLFYGNHYHSLLENNPDAKCWYILKNIRHSTGANTIESVKLEMPAEQINITMEFSL
jgi:hypothetical protein